MRNAFAFVKFAEAGLDVAACFHHVHVSVPVLDIADEGGGAAVLRDEDEAVRLAHALQACGKIVAAFRE